MMSTETVRLLCPYCGEPVDIVVDTSVDLQDYFEDCSVCCRPMELTVAVVDDDISVSARRDDE